MKSFSNSFLVLWQVDIFFGCLILTYCSTKTFIIMENHFSNVPIWVSISFIFIFPITIYFIARTIKQGAINAQISDNQSNKIFLGVIMFFSLYLIYVSVMAFTGLLSVNTLPPKVLVFTALPLIIFFFGFIFNKLIYWKILDGIPLQSLVRLHIFRFVGVYFLLVTYFNALPAYFAILAGLGDMATALGAIFIAKAVEENKSWIRKATLVWNIFGFLDIGSVIISAILTTKYSIEHPESQSIIEMAKFPFVWIPAFAPAVIIFIHISIFNKLKRGEGGDGLEFVLK